MRNVSPTPERAFEELSILVELALLENAGDEQRLCSAFQSSPGLYSVIQDDWVRTGRPGKYRNFGRLPYVMNMHIDGCYACKSAYVQRSRARDVDLLEFSEPASKDELTAIEASKRTLRKKIQEMTKGTGESHIT